MAASDMMAATAAVGQVGTEQSYDEQGVDAINARHIQERYDEERAKRLREDGVDQFIDISLADKFRHFQHDPFVDPAAVRNVEAMFPDRRCELLILGAGFGGIMYAVRMIEAGMPPEHLRIIDSAGDFGGTWYWNRYPGLACDIESYCYLPLLEETGYMPKHRYSHGGEIRDYARLVARKYKFADSAVFQTKADKLVWDEAAKEWQVDLTQTLNGQKPQTLGIRSRFVVTANGVLNWPKLPGLPGILDYKGETFHTARWDYTLTGGSQADPSLSKLKDKRVAIIGTGCSAVQVVPHLARWAKHLYVVQRTPAAVDQRDQRETNPDLFRNEVATSKGWQRERLRNFHQHFTTGKQPKVNLVNDQWTTAVGMVAISGNSLGPKTPEDLPAYMKTLHELDDPRQERIRARVDAIVKDRAVAEQLKPWYPTWCKRPAFSDDYLPCFNRDNVTLIDTDGKGLDCVTNDSIVYDGQSHPVDVIIFATGYRPPYGGTPAEKANLTISGRDGVSMTNEWAARGPSTLHGIIDRDFPNLFLSGPWQASTSPNYLFGEAQLARHAAYVWAAAMRRAGGKTVAVTPEPAAVDDWGAQIMARSAPMAAIIGCTPSYFNQEGALDRIPKEAQPLVARSGLWGLGIEDFLEHMEAWRSNEGDIEDILVQT